MRRKTFVIPLTKAGKPMRKGGKRPGAGRPKNSGNNIKIDLNEHMQAVMNKAAADGKSPPTALEIWQAIYRDPLVPQKIRREAAKVCLQYESARIAPTELTDPTGGPLASRLNGARETLTQKLLAASARVRDQEVPKQLH